MEKPFESECKMVFELFDRDGNGYVDATELADGLRALGGNPTSEEVDELIQASESRKSEDGHINFEEFVGLMEKFRKSSDKEEDDLEQAFKCFDANGDGRINREEMKNALTKTGMGRLSEEEVDQLFESADTDDDGYINYRELIKMIMR